jgi:hypothetical protein
MKLLIRKLGISIIGLSLTFSSSSFIKSFNINDKNEIVNNLNFHISQNNSVNNEFKTYLNEKNAREYTKELFGYDLNREKFFEHQFITNPNGSCIKSYYRDLNFSDYKRLKNIDFFCSTFDSITIQKNFLLENFNALTNEIHTKVTNVFNSDVLDLSKHLNIQKFLLIGYLLKSDMKLKII